MSVWKWSPRMTFQAFTLLIYMQMMFFICYSYFIRSGDVFNMLKIYEMRLKMHFLWQRRQTSLRTLGEAPKNLGPIFSVAASAQSDHFTPLSFIFVSACSVHAQWLLQLLGQWHLGQEWSPLCSTRGKLSLIVSLLFLWDLLVLKCRSQVIKEIWLTWT